MGEVTGLFVTTPRELKSAIGKYVTFGEVLGKHSDISAVMEEHMFTVKSDDKLFIKQLVDIIGHTTISGHNPLSYIADAEV